MQKLLDGLGPMSQKYVGLTCPGQGQGEAVEMTAGKTDRKLNACLHRLWIGVFVNLEQTAGRCHES